MSRVYFWDKVKRAGPDECWPWQGFTKPSGHGLTSLDSMPIHASRKAWILTFGPIRGRLCVNHLCDNAACCNPAHLYLGTRSENMHDMWFLVPKGQRPNGSKFGLDEKQIARIHEMRRAGETFKECAEELGVTYSTIWRHLNGVYRERIRRLREDRLSRSCGQ